MRKINTKRALGLGVAAVIAAGVPATMAAASASAAVVHPVTSVTQISGRNDGGGGGNTWAKDAFTRTLTVNYLGRVSAAELLANPALASTPYKYNAVIRDTNGTFRDLPGQLTPDQGGNDAGKVLRTVQVTGPMSGFGQFGVFYASAKAHNGLAPQTLRGASNLAYPSSTWPTVAFLPGTTFASLNEAVYDYNYQAVPFTKYVVKVVNGKRVIVPGARLQQHWEDSSWNGDGQIPRGDGNITGLDH